MSTPQEFIKNGWFLLAITVLNVAINKKNCFNCPKCGHKQICPCKSCKNPIDLKPWVWQADGNSVSCGNCGLVKSADDWAEIEYKQYQQLKGNNDE